MVQQAIIWSILYPITLLGFVCVTLWRIFWFLFNSPVDIWTMIGEAVNEQEEVEKQQNDTDNQRL